MLTLGSLWCYLKSSLRDTVKLSLSLITDQQNNAVYLKVLEPYTVLLTDLSHGRFVFMLTVCVSDFAIRR